MSKVNFERRGRGLVIGEEYDSPRSPGIPPTLSKYGFDCVNPHPLDEQVIARVREWLANAPKIGTPTGWLSYGLKHVAEEALGISVANGELIAACIQAGFAVKQDWGRTPNAMIGVSKAWVQKQVVKSKRAGSSHRAGPARP